MKSWFGPIDGLLRTATALLSYLAVLWIKEEFGWTPPFLAAQAFAVVVALALSGLASTRIWKIPSLKLVWKSDKVVVEDRVFSIRSSDSRKRRLITHEVQAPDRSLLSWILMRRLSKEQVWLYIRVIPDGVFHLSEDMSPTNITFQMATAGFEHNLPDLDQVGTVALTRVEWEPVSKGLPVRCKVKYALRSSSRRGRALARLVHLDASVKAVELS